MSNYSAEYQYDVKQLRMTNATRMRLVSLSDGRIQFRDAGVIKRTIGRLSAWLATWAGGRLAQEVKGIDYTTDDMNSLLNKIQMSERDISRLHGHKCPVILVGRDIATRIWAEDRICSAFGMFSPIAMANREVVAIFGITIIVVPWMNGWCLLSEGVVNAIQNQAQIARPARSN